MIDTGGVSPAASPQAGGATSSSEKRLVDVSIYDTSPRAHSVHLIVHLIAVTRGRAAHSSVVRYHPTFHKRTS